MCLPVLHTSSPELDAIPHLVGRRLGARFRDACRFVIASPYVSRVVRESCGARLQWPGATARSPETASALGIYSATQESGSIK